MSVATDAAGEEPPGVGAPDDVAPATMRDATPTSRNGRQDSDESHDDNSAPTLPLTRRRALQAAGAAAGTASITGATAANGGTLAGPHETPDPLPPAADDERSLFQAAVDGAICRVDSPGARTGIESKDRDPAGAVRVWVADVGGDPTARVTVAVEDDREVVTIGASAWPDADGLREWATNLRHRTDDSGTAEIDGGEVLIHSSGPQSEVCDRATDGSLTVGWSPFHDGVTTAVSTGDSWARVFVVGDTRDELATAAVTAAEVIDE